MIQVQTPDGGTAEFPDDTSPDTIRSAMRAKFGGGPAKQVAQQMTGNVPVKTTLQSAAENFLPSAGNLVKGTAGTIGEAAKVAANPLGLGYSSETGITADPTRAPRFIKDLVVGTYEGLKQRYGDGLERAIAKDPVGVIADVLSVAGGLRGVRTGGGVEVPTRAATRADAIVGRDMATDVANQTATGVGPTPMDRGGTAIANQVERLSNTSAGGRDILEPFLTKRQAGQYSRITEDLKSLAGTTRTARQALDETVEKQRAAGKPLYERAYQAGDREILVSDDILSSPAVKTAMQSAVTSWRDNAVANGYGAMNPTQISRGGIIKFGGSIPAFPNIQFWDYTKGALDSMIDGEKTPTGRLTRRGNTLNTIKNKLLAQLDSQVPEYGAARQAWSGPASYMSALEMGKDIFSASADNFVPDFNNLSKADKQAVRESAITKIVSDLGKSSTDIGADLRDLSAKLKNREMVQKVLALLPDDASRKSWLSKLREEVNSSQLVGRGLKGSQTARRLAQAADASDLVGDMVLGAIKGSLEGGVTTKARIIVKGWKAVRDKIQASTDREMAKILTGQKTSTKIQKPVGNRAPLLIPALTSQQQ